MTSIFHLTQHLIEIPKVWPSFFNIKWLEVIDVMILDITNRAIKMRTLMMVWDEESQISEAIELASINSTYFTIYKKTFT